MAPRGSRATSPATTGRAAAGSTGSAPTSTRSIPVWKDLNRFFRGKFWRRKPFAITEWAVYGKDEPRFVKQLVAWTAKRKRVRMFIYYPGFGPGENPYDLRLYPRTTNTLRLKARRPNFLQYAEYNVGTLPELPPKPKKAARKARLRIDEGPGFPGPSSKPLAC